MSTLHKNAEISTKVDQKLSMSLDNNATKGVMDNVDKVTGSYSGMRQICERGTSSLRSWGRRLWYRLEQHMQRTPAAAATVRKIQERTSQSTPGCCWGEKKVCKHTVITCP